MTRDQRHDILFEPVRIGPVTARNRFYQVPHCTGIGWTQPDTLARLRGIKAEGGWAVVATEETEIHPSADCEPFHEGRLWDDRDIPAMALDGRRCTNMVRLAARSITHHGASVAELGTRMAPIGPSHRPIICIHRCRRGRSTRMTSATCAMASDAALRLKERASISSTSMRRTTRRSRTSSCSAVRTTARRIWRQFPEIVSGFCAN